MERNEPSPSAAAAQSGVAPAGVAPAGVAPAGVAPAGVAPAGVAPAHQKKDNDLHWGFWPFLAFVLFMKHGGGAWLLRILYRSLQSWW